MNNKKIQDEELNQVNGGVGKSSTHIQCQNCDNRFSPSGCTHKDITTGSGCSESYTRYYQCPHCGKWVNIDGEVNSDLN